MSSEADILQTVEQKISGARVLNIHNNFMDVEIECLPEYGGRLNRLVLNSDGEKRDIIAGFDSEEELRADTFFRNVILFPFINRLDEGKWLYNEQELQFPVNETELNNALHGFLFRKSLEVISTRNDQEGIEINLGYDYRAEYEYYPFNLDIRLTYRISSPETLSLHFDITNVGTDDAPMALGWHPYFTLDEGVENLELTAPPMEQILVDDRLLPTGETQPFTDFDHRQKLGNRKLDTCFALKEGGETTTTLYSPQRQTEITVRQDDLFNYMQLFIPPDRKSIAIEPVTSNINAFQTGEGLMCVAPHQRINGSISVSINKKD